MELPEALTETLAPLFARLPQDAALGRLVVRERQPDDVVAIANEIAKTPAFAGRPAMLAGLWLYVDDLEASHIQSQSLESATGAYWHGIMHRREGDFSNSHYWFRRAGQHPAMAEIPEYDGHAFIDEVASYHPQEPSFLVDRQRAEWQALFSWCAINT